MTLQPVWYNPEAGESWINLWTQQTDRWHRVPVELHEYSSSSRFSLGGFDATDIKEEEHLSSGTSRGWQTAVSLLWTLDWSLFSSCPIIYISDDVSFHFDSHPFIFLEFLSFVTSSDHLFPFRISNLLLLKPFCQVIFRLLPSVNAPVAESWKRNQFHEQNCKKKKNPFFLSTSALITFPAITPPTLQACGGILVFLLTGWCDLWSLTSALVAR